MKIYNVLFILLCHCLSISCVNQDDSATYRIDVSDNEARRIYAADFDSIKLETSQNSMIYDIGDIIPYHEGYVVVGKEKALYFRSDGTFVCRIGDKGRGEGEYLSLSSCYVYQDTIHIFSSQNKAILKYTLRDGRCEYSGKVKTPDTLSLRKIVQNDLYPNRYYCLNTYHGTGGVVPSLCIYDTDFHKVASSSSFIKDGGMSYQYPFSSTKDGLFFTDFLSYTITELQYDSIDESRTFNFMKNNYPEECTDYTDVHDAMHRINKLDAWNKTIVTHTVKAGNYLFVGLSSGRMARYDTLTGKSSVVRFMKSTSEPMMYPAFLIEDGTLLLASSASDETLDNPPVYKIPLEIFGTASHNQ